MSDQQQPTTGEQTPDVVHIHGAGGAHIGTITLGDASPLAVIAQLGERLWYAERALALAGATTAPPPTEMGNAALQAWAEWAQRYGETAADVTDTEIRALAQTRAGVDAQILAAIHGAAPTTVTGGDETTTRQDQTRGDSGAGTHTNPNPATHSDMNGEPVLDDFGDEPPDPPGETPC